MADADLQGLCRWIGLRPSMPFPPIKQMSECVNIKLQDIYELSDWVPRPDGSIYVMKTMITTKIMKCENSLQSIENERRKSPIVYVVTRSYITLYIICVLQFKLISVRHVIT